ncbi:MAG: hypothetical protein QOF51_3479 [Chloroflexota bacterium]|nr:hypothetical protein [Chloroflexota bacterium]
MVDTLRINTFGRSAPHEAAVKQGFYAAENLEVEHAATQSSKAQMRDLLDGKWQIVHTNADNVFWWSEDNGADLLIVLASPSEPGQDFVVRPEIAGYEALRGKPLAVDAAESGYVTPLRLLLQEHGLTEEGRDFSLVEVGNTQFRIDAMRDERCVGAMIGGGQSKELEADGFHILDSINRLYTHYSGSTATRRDWAEQHGDLVVRYLRAHLRALQWIAAQSGKPADVQPFEWEGMREMLETRRRVGMLRGAVDPHRFATQQYYDQAVASLARTV